MKRLVIIGILTIFLVGCSSNVRFISTDSTYICKAKPKNANIVFRRGRITRPHRVIGVIEAKLGRKARRPELDALLMKKARAIGADGVMLAGCEPGGCHFGVDSECLDREYEKTRNILEMLGIRNDRLALVHLPTFDGHQFVAQITKFITQIEHVPTRRARLAGAKVG